MSASTPPPVATKRPWFKKKRIIIPLAVLLFVVIVGSLSPQTPTANKTPAVVVQTTSPADKAAADQAATAQASADAQAKVDKAAADKAAAKKAAADKAAAAAPQIGKKFRDGDLEFVVLGVAHLDKTLVDPSGALEATAQGEFVLVRATVTNISARSVMTGNGGDVLLNNKGQKFDTSDASIYLAAAANFSLVNINPGNKVTVSLLYDVPSGTKITGVELHDSIFSGGVKVRL